MSINPSIFKAYDVRGLYPEQLDEDGAYRVARAFARVLPELRGGPREGGLRLALGHDMRLHSPALAEAFTRGLVDEGCHVLDIGMVGTEMVYYAIGSRELDGGVSVTASHNPKAWAGFKLLREGARALSGDEGIQDVRRVAESEELSEPSAEGSVEREDIYEEFQRYALGLIDSSVIRPMELVLDGGNGMAGPMIGPILDGFPVRQAPLYFTPNGEFPGHEPNPLLPENREFIVAKTREEGADFGVAYDGDADRCFFVDDTGEFVPGDVATALLAEAVLEKEPGAKVLYDVRASWAVPETIERAGGIPLVNRVGHAFIKQRMRQEHAAFGGEVSGHYYFRDFTQADSGVIPFLLMLERISKGGVKLSELLRAYRERYFITGELNTPVADVDAKLRELEARFGSEGTVSHLDGVSVNADDWHFNVRPSNTEPLLRLNLEARSQALMERKRDEVLALIRA